MPPLLALTPPLLHLVRVLVRLCLPPAQQLRLARYSATPLARLPRRHLSPPWRRPR